MEKRTEKSISRGKERTDTITMKKNIEMERELIALFWEKKRIQFVKKDDLAAFINDYFEPRLKKSTKKAELVEKMKLYLNEETLQLFSERLERFGLLKSDIASYYGMTLNSVNKLVDDSLIRQNGECTLRGIDVRQEVKIYDMFSIAEAYKNGKITFKEKKPLVVPAMEDENIREALYIINKSAKKSRDSKNKNYRLRNYSALEFSRTRAGNLYVLKDAVIKKLLEEGKATFAGYQRQVLPGNERITYLKIYRFCGRTIHSLSDRLYVNENEIVAPDITEPISAERTDQVTMSYRQAVRLLEEYSGEKLAGAKKRQLSKAKW